MRCDRCNVISAHLTKIVMPQNNRRMICDVCRKSLMQWWLKNLEECPVCQGHGELATMVPYNTTVCDRCGGSGLVRSA